MTQPDTSNKFPGLNGNTAPLAGLQHGECSSPLLIWDAYVLCPRYGRAGRVVLEEHTVIRHFYRSPYANTEVWFSQSWFWRITLNTIYSKCLGAFMSEDSYIAWRVKRPRVGFSLTPYNGAASLWVRSCLCVCSPVDWQGLLKRDSVDHWQTCMTGIILQLATREWNWPVGVRDSQLNTDWSYSTAW